MEVQVGDRFTDETGEWEVVSHPVVLHTRKSLRAKVRSVSEPATEQEVIWPARVRLTVQRAGVEVTARRDTLPFLLPWFRLALLIRSITDTTWDEATWPTVKAELRQALRMRAGMARWWN